MNKKSMRQLVLVSNLLCFSPSTLVYSFDHGVKGKSVGAGRSVDGGVKPKPIKISYEDFEKID